MYVAEDGLELPVPIIPPSRWRDHVQLFSLTICIFFIIVDLCSLLIKMKTFISNRVILSHISAAFSALCFIYVKTLLSFLYIYNI